MSENVHHLALRTTIYDIDSDVELFLKGDIARENTVEIVEIFTLVWCG